MHDLHFLLQVSAGRGGTVFDEDPKRWRMIAEGFTSTGRALEIATAVFPQQFVLLAGVNCLYCKEHHIMPSVHALNVHLLHQPLQILAHTVACAVYQY